MTSLRHTKTVLRKDVKDTLKKLTDVDKGIQSRVIIKKALELDEYKSSSRISIFLPMPDEVNTLPILKTMLRDGKDCFIPHYEGKDMIMVPLKTWEEYEALPTNSWNIKQPVDFDSSNDASVTGGLDLIFMPGLAFTLKGARLGRGKGYYDTYLDQLRQRGSRPKTIGLAYKEQILPNVPLSDHDVIIDRVIFPSPEEMNGDVMKEHDIVS